MTKTTMQIDIDKDEMLDQIMDGIVEGICNDLYNDTNWLSEVLAPAIKNRVSNELVNETVKSAVDEAISYMDMDRIVANAVTNRINTLVDIKFNSLMRGLLKDDKSNIENTDVEIVDKP